MIALDDKTVDVMKHKGALQRLSPPELAIAVLFSIRDAIKQSADDNILMKWRSLALTASFQFEVVWPGEDRYWRAQNIRQECIEHGEVAQLSVRQWIYDVVGFKDSKEKELQKTLSALAVAKMFEDRMKYARSSERIKDSFVDSAVTIFKRVLSVQAANHWLEWCEQNLMEKSPWKSVYALQALVDRAQTTDRITWALWGLTDYWRMEYLDLGAFSIAKLRDYRQSYVEVMNLKLGVRDELLQHWLPSSGMHKDQVSKIQEVMADFGTVRAFVTPYSGQQADTTWMVGRPESALSAVELIEELVYSNTWDSRYKDAIKSKLRVPDFLDYESVRAHLEDILSQVKAERTAAGGISATPEAGSSQAGSAGAGNGGGAGSALAETPEKGFHSLQPSEQVQWDKVIEKQIRTYIQLIPDQKTQSGLECKIKECPLASIRGDPTGLVLYHFDVKQCGEPCTRPELRIAPLRDAHYHRLVRAALNARTAGQAASLKAGEVAILLDGGRKGNMSKLLAPWKEGTLRNSSKKGGDADDEEEAEEDDEDEDQRPGFVPALQCRCRYACRCAYCYLMDEVLQTS